MIIVRITNKTLVAKLKFDEEKTLGINKKIINGLVIPPDRQRRIPNCKISISKKKKADLSDSCVFLYMKIKYRLLKIPKNITIFDVTKSKSEFKKKNTKFIASS